MKMKLLFFSVLLVLGLSANAQENPPSNNSQSEIRKGFAVYPLEKQIGYRSNLTRKWFTDFKGGMTYSALPFFVLELNRNRRFVNTDRVKVYSGLGLTLDSYVPGVQVPLGIEFIPLADVKQLSIIAEAKPKISLGPTNFLNISFSPHIGVAYYLKMKTVSKG
jgi:hypothetical protein